MISPSKKILCIEDDAETAALIAEDLQDRGYAVSIAADGHSGLSAILKSGPDLVLCDINMPGMTGFEVMERLIALAPKFEAVPFIFLTARTDRDSELKGRRLGADDYVTKPVDFEILAAIIDARGLRQVTDTGAIDKAIDAVLAANPDKLAEYKAGKEKLFGFLVGQVMKASRGKANPTLAEERLRAHLA